MSLSHLYEESRLSQAIHTQISQLNSLLKINMDKSWINIQNRLDPLYEKGADDFVGFESKDRPNATEIICPCTKCRNMKFVKKINVPSQEKSAD
ncbi:hypothetical protein RJ639_030826 [Escallonia herrerae]|uniref:Transposase-associated domain-containing protein n=1 Tax=Escallonia herrerae TaxID=1293975 RepID=A0AA89BAT6_9ASTE|nr:hypothetical protein RJ639_030826 [Escallonia herrerae]